MNAPDHKGLRKDLQRDLHKEKSLHRGLQEGLQKGPQKGLNKGLNKGLHEEKGLNKGPNDVLPAQDPKPFVEDYLAALLGQAAQLIQGEFHRVVREHGFSVSEWRVLATLADGQAMTTGRLAEISLTKGPTATRLLDRMVARGQVERLPDAADRRVTRIRITADGQRTVSSLIAMAREHEARVLAPFGLDQAEALKATLRGLIEQRRRTR
jgi:DNA-binding MarR family transcriptional regulator